MKNNALNPHMNLFHFFSENHDIYYRERNISRAFAICLQNDLVFQHAFLKEILNPGDYDSLFYVHDGDSEVSIDIEKETKQLVESTTTLYAIGLTDSQDEMDWSNISDNIVKEEKGNQTDIVISIKDLKIIIEIKKFDHDCREQLRQQIAPFLDDNILSADLKINTKHYRWTFVMALLEKVINYYTYNGQNVNTFLLHSFLDIVKKRFPSWITNKPFSMLPFYDKGTPEHQLMSNRLQQSINTIGENLVANLWDRTSILMHRAWGTEVTPHFWLDKKDNQPYLCISAWPGNTKQQGWSLYHGKGPAGWSGRNALSIDGTSYEIVIERLIKFAQYSRHKTGLLIPMDETDDLLNMEINTAENQRDLAGRWKRPYWQQLEEEFDSYFKVDWRKRCEWDSEFINSGKSYVDISLGYSITVYIPYSKLRAIDKTEEGYKAVGQFLVQCKDAIVDMVENK